MIHRKSAAQFDITDHIARSEGLQLRNHVAVRIGLLFEDGRYAEGIEFVADHEFARLVLTGRSGVPINLVVCASLKSVERRRYVFDDVVVQIAQLTKLRESKDRHRIAPCEERSDDIAVIKVPLATKRQRAEVAGSAKKRVPGKNVIRIVAREPGVVEARFDIEYQFRVLSKKADRLFALQANFRHRQHSTYPSA